MIRSTLIALLLCTLYTSQHYAMLNLNLSEQPNSRTLRCNLIKVAAGCTFAGLAIVGSVMAAQQLTKVHSCYDSNRSCYKVTIDSCSICPNGLEQTACYASDSIETLRTILSKSNCKVTTEELSASSCSVTTKPNFEKCGSSLDIPEIEQPNISKAKTNVQKVPLSNTSPIRRKILRFRNLRNHRKRV